jgi:hypothetical protein
VVGGGRGAVVGGGTVVIGGGRGAVVGGGTVVGVGSGAGPLVVGGGAINGGASSTLGAARCRGDTRLIVLETRLVAAVAASVARVDVAPRRVVVGVALRAPAPPAEAVRTVVGAPALLVQVVGVVASAVLLPGADFWWVAP